MTRQLRIGFAQALGLGVNVANEYLAYAIRQTVFESQGSEWSEQYSIHYLENDIPNKLKQASVIFATDAGRPVGCILFGFQKRKAPWLPDANNYELLYIDTLYVAPEYRRQGIAKLLIKMAVRQHVSSTGAVLLVADDDNEKALALYHSLGFKDVSFIRASSGYINTVKEIRAMLKSIKARFGKHKVTSKKIDIIDDVFIIMQLQRHGLQSIFGGQHIFSFDEDEVLPKGMKWRRRYYGLNKGDKHHLLSRTMPLLNYLARFVNYGIYMDDKLVGIYSLWEPTEEMTNIFIFPTDDDTAANLARFALYDAMIQLLPSKKENGTTGYHNIAFQPSFFLSYLCLTEKEKQFWSDEDFVIMSLALLGNRAHIRETTNFSIEQRASLPLDMRLCYAVASGQVHIALPPQMSADDWLFLISGIQQRRDFWLERNCKDFSVFSKESLVALFAAREISKDILFANVTTQDLSVEDWAKILWVGKECIPMCPKEIWMQFTPSLWEKIMANNTSKEWHFGDIEEWKSKSYSDEIKAFIAEHPAFVDKYPIGSSYRYKVHPWEILGRTELDDDGVKYPEVLKMNEPSDDARWISDDEDDKADEEEDEYAFN